MNTSLGHVAGLALSLHLSLVAGVEHGLALPVAHLGAALLEEGVLDRGVDGVVGRPALGPPAIPPVAVVPSDDVQNFEVEDGENLEKRILYARC